MSNEWDDFASGWDANEDVLVYAQKAFDSLTRKVLPFVSDLPVGRVLDFGCGTGLLSEKLSLACDQIVAVDTSTRMVDVFQEKITKAGIGNITTLSIAINAATVSESVALASKFDMVLASSVCSFLPDYEATLTVLTSLLKSGGHFVQWDWLADMPVARIRSAFDTSGLVTLSIEEAFSITADEKPMPVVMGIGRLAL